MAINVLTNYNFNRNQIINAVVDNRLRSTIPEPREGQIAYDTDSKRVYYWNGDVWEGSDAINAMDKLDGSGLVDYINGVSTTTTINNNRLTHNNITLGTTNIALGGTKTNLEGLTINDVEFFKQPTGFTVEGGVVKKKLTINDSLTSDTNSLTLGSGKIITGYANLTAGSTTSKGDLTIKSDDNSHRTLILSNESLELSGSGSKLTIEDSPTIAGGGKITVPTNSKVILQGNSAVERTLTLGGSVTLNGTSSATLNAPLVIGTPTSNTGIVTLRSNGSSATTITSTGNVTLIAGTMVNSADPQLHMQNTDMGTSSSTFQINTASGVILESQNMLNENLELRLRNPANDDFASLRVKNLFVEGETTSIVSNEVSIGDNEIELNADVEDEDSNGFEAGLSVKRFTGAVENHAKITFTENTGKWGTTNINNGVATTFQLTNKFVETFGNGSDTTFTITHNLNTRDLAVTIRETGGNFGLIFADIDFSDLNSIDIITSPTAVPATNQYTVTIVG